MSAEELLNAAVEAYSKPLPAVPNAPGIDTKDIKKEYKRTGATRDQLSSGVDYARQMIDDAFRSTGTAVTAGANADAALGDEKQRKAQQEADINKRTNEITGFGLEETDQVVKWSRLATEATNKAMELDQAISANTVNFLDNPLGWLESKFNEPQLVNEYNAQANIANTATQAAAAKKQEADALAARALSALPKITLAEQKAANDKILAEAAVTRGRLQTEFAKNDVDFLQRKYSADLSQLQAAISKGQIDAQAAQMQFSAQMKRIELAQSEGARMAEAAKFRMMGDDLKADGLQVENYNRVTGANLTVTQMKRMPKEMQDNIAAISTGSWGSGPAYALKNVTSLPTGELPEATRKSFQYLQTLQSQVEGDTQVQMKLKGLKADERIAYINGLMQDRIKADLADAATNSTSKFHEVKFTEMVEKGLVFKADNPITQTLLKVQEVSKDPIGSQEIGTALLDQYAGNANAAARVLTQYYRTNIDLRNSTGQFTTIGVPREELKSYKTTLNLGFGFGGSQQFDLTDPVDAQKYVVALDKMRTRSFGDRLLRQGAVGATVGSYQERKAAADKLKEAQ